MEPSFERPAGIFLSGKVMMEDGTAPPESVVIERVCNGTPRPEAYTDSKGRFSFQLGQNMSMMPDASVSSSSDPGGRPGIGGGSISGRPGGLNQRDLMGCEIRASLAGFRSDVVNLAGRRMMDNPDVGTIILRRMGNVQGTVISATSLQAPKDAKKAYEKGRNALKKKKWEDAQKHLEKAVEVYPRYAAAWFELGMAKQQQNKLDEAKQAYEQSIGSDDKYLRPYISLAGLAASEKKWQDVVNYTNKVSKLDPIDFPEAWFYNAVANFNLQNLDEAERSAREAVKLDTRGRIAKAPHLLAIILYNKRDYSGAAQYMKSYLQQNPNAQDASTVRQQLTQLEQMTGTVSVQPVQPKKD